MIPPQAGAARDQYVLNAIRTGNFAVQWATITSDAGGHHAEFRIFADALQVDGIRVQVSAFLQQTIADLLNCSLLTAKLADLSWAQRVATLPPFPQPIANMASTATSIAYSAKIDAALATAGNPQGVIETVGKNWILTNLLVTPNGQPILKSSGHAAACNYGWPYVGNSFQGRTWDTCASLPGCHLIQGRGTAHDLLETDYSQVCKLVARECLVDGAVRDLHDILTDPVLAQLASAEGVLRVLRQPGVPVQAPIVNPPSVGPAIVSWLPGVAPVLASTSASSGGNGLLLAGGLLLVGSFLGSLALLSDARPNPTEPLFDAGID